MTKHAVIDLPEEVYARLREVLAQAGRSESEFMLEAVLQAIEDFEDLQDAEQITMQIRSGEMTTSPLEEVSKRLGLDD